MKLYCWQGEAKNFGDELNRLLWPALLPDFFDDDASEIVLGIGSVLDRRHPPDRLKIVIGSGYGGYEGLPKIDRSWVIHWVRGPQTAELLGLDPASGLGDPAMLWPLAPGLAAREIAPKGRPGYGRSDDGQPGYGPTGPDIGFMPHFESLARGHWADAAAAAGMRLIDPRDDPLEIVARIASCRMLVSEAMHGAIIADTLRVPWIALNPQAPVHRAKWHDWAGALGMAVRFQQAPPSSLYEWVSTHSLAGGRPARLALRHLRRGLRAAGARRRIEQAADALRRVAAGPGQLSEPSALRRCQERMLTCLNSVRRHPRTARPHASS